MSWVSWKQVTDKLNNADQILFSCNKLDRSDTEHIIKKNTQTEQLLRSYVFFTPFSAIHCIGICDKTKSNQSFWVVF
jgi:hypothetical protein